MSKLNVAFAALQNGVAAGMTNATHVMKHMPLEDQLRVERTIIKTLRFMADNYETDANRTQAILDEQSEAGHYL